MDIQSILQEINQTLESLRQLEVQAAERRLHLLVIQIKRDELRVKLYREHFNAEVK